MYAVDDPRVVVVAEGNAKADTDSRLPVGSLLQSSGAKIIMTVTTVAETNTGDGVTPQSPSIDSDQNTSRLLLLPQEIFDGITSYLGPEHIVMLALVNKELFGRFLRRHPPSHLPPPTSLSSSSPPPPSPSPWRALGDFLRANLGSVKQVVLKKLERDLLDLAYCYKCRILHSPFTTFVDAAYAPRKARGCADYGGDHHIPPRATRKLLLCIAKRRLAGRPHADLVRQVNNTSTRYAGGVLGQVALRLRHRRRSTLLRRRQVVSAVDKTPLALWLFGQQLEPASAVGGAVRSLPKVHRICNHRMWIDRYAGFVDRLVRPLCERVRNREEHPVHTHACFSGVDPCDPGTDGGHAIAARLAYLRDSISSSSKASQPGAEAEAEVESETTTMDVPGLLGAVRSCSQCMTDYSLDVAPLPAPFGWGFVLTTWLDMGHLGRRTGMRWMSHREDAARQPALSFRRWRDAAQAHHPDICQRFEDLPEGCAAARPEPHPRDLERIRNYGWAERAAEGVDRYVKWESSHCVDPMTGAILDPDPLDDGDI